MTFHSLKGWACFRGSAGKASLFFLCLLGLLVLVAGCASTNGTENGKGGGLFGWFKKAVQEPDQSAQGLTKEAMDYYARGRYLLAEEIFQKIRDRYPFSPLATLAELRLADCKFHQGLYEEAIPLYEEFEKLHPTNEAIPYVIFQEGACYHELMCSADRDQTNTHKMIETYQRLLKRFPDSPYTYEGKRRILEGRNRLAEHEIVVAKWYLNTKQYPQARKRLETAINLYPDTKACKEARRLLKRLDKIPMELAADAEPWWERVLP